MIPNPFSKISGNLNSFNFSANDLRLILDQIQNPALLINLDKKIIAVANYRFTELTGIGSNEIAKTEIGHIFLDWSEEKIADGAISQLSVIRKKKNPIQIGIRAQFVSSQEKLVLLIFLLDNRNGEQSDNVNRNLYAECVDILDGIRGFPCMN